MRSMRRRLKALEAAVIPEAMIAAIAEYEATGTVPATREGARLALLFEEWREICAASAARYPLQDLSDDDDDPVAHALWLHSRLTGRGLAEIAIDADGAI